MHKIAIFGATGSIGSSALDVISRHPDALQASVLAAGSRVDALLALCRGLEIAPAGVVAFGDSDSDAPMLQLAGYGVSVGAATELTRAAAREHISGPGSEAVAEWLGRIAVPV